MLSGAIPSELSTLTELEDLLVLIFYNINLNSNPQKLEI